MTSLKICCYAVLLAAVFIATSNAQPAMSRGEQLLQITYEECINRARQAFVTEGWVNISSGGAFMQAFKGGSGAYIMCNVAPENKVWANIVVASLSNDSGVPGGERGRLQQRMSGSVAVVPVAGPLMGDWDMKCCNDALAWTLSITKQDGSTFSGTFSAAHAGGVVVNGQVRGNTIRIRSRGSSRRWRQHWSAQLVNDGGRLRMINGVWSGNYQEQFAGRNNWHAEKK